jgi:hypothetical protein
MPYLPLLWSPYSGPAQETNSTPNVEEPLYDGPFYLTYISLAEKKILTIARIIKIKE